MCGKNRSVHFVRAVNVKVVEYDKPSVLLKNGESAFSRLVAASQVDDVKDASDAVQPRTAFIASV